MRRYEAAAAAAPELTDVYAALAELLHCAPGDLAVLSSATAAWQAAVGGLAWGWRVGDRLLTFPTEYGSNYIALLQLAKRTGAVIEVLPETPAGDVDLDALAAALARPGAGRAALVSLTHAPTSSGRVYDAAGVGAVLARHWAAAEADAETAAAFCRGAEAAGDERKRRRGDDDRGREDVSAAAAVRAPPLPAYVVDGCQSVGQLAVDARALRCDFLSATGRKFLRAPRGSGFLYASPRALRLTGNEPALADNVGAEWTAINSYALATDARRYESYELSVAAKLGLGVAVRELLALGPARVFRRIAALGAELRALLEDVPGVRVLDRGARLGGIVSCAVAGAPAGTVVAALSAAGVNASVSAAASTRLDFEARGIAEIVRFSPHAYNTSKELAAAAAVVAIVAAEAGA